MGNGITPGWRFVAIGLDGAAISLAGLNPWQLKWRRLDEPAITVAHPSHPEQRHQMWIYELRNKNRTVKFAAGEYSNGVWGFYVPT